MRQAAFSRGDAVLLCLRDNLIVCGPNARINDGAGTVARAGRRPGRCILVHRTKSAFLQLERLQVDWYGSDNEVNQGCRASAYASGLDCSGYRNGLGKNQERCSSTNGSRSYSNGALKALKSQFTAMQVLVSCCRYLFCLLSPWPAWPGTLTLQLEECKTAR